MATVGVSDPDERGLVQMTPLHNAAKDGNEKLVDTLIKAGVHVARNEYQRTLLHFGALADHLAEACLFIRAGANVNQRDDR